MAAGQQNKKHISLALQGGGSHGAYTWGVLDRILEDDNIAIDAITGTSAGAMNAAVLIDGYMKDGNKGARTALANFWRRISDMGKMGHSLQSPFEKMISGWNLDFNISYNIFNSFNQFFSPYFFNPTDYNPIRHALEESIDIHSVNSCSAIRLFIAATKVSSGQVRIFECDEITIDVLLASACLPNLFQAKRIEGEYYWDGGYSGNPALWPLMRYCKTGDVLIVQVNPFIRKDLPVTTHDIINRVNEISFNASILSELEMIQFLHDAIEKGELRSDNGFKLMNLHMVHSETEMVKLHPSSKSNVDFEFLTYLHDLGWNETDKWLFENYDNIGVKSTINIRQTVLETT